MGPVTEEAVSRGACRTVDVERFVINTSDRANT
jgi:hypothetical protein